MTRLRWIMRCCFPAFCAATCTFASPQPKLLWNASASAPIGLYALQRPAPLEDSDLVAVRPPEPIASFLADRGYLPRGVLLIKHILARPGQIVCRADLWITVDRVEVGEAQTRDRRGRDLPTWQGCRRLRSDEVFVMNRTVPDSLDGRYFGPLPVTSIVARAVPLWTDQTGDGHFAWRAKAR